MGILGSIKLKRRSRNVYVGDDLQGNPVELTLHPPRLDSIDEWEEDMPKPTPPLAKSNKGKPVPERDANGNPLTDPATGAVLYARNYTDPDYIRAMGRRQKALTIRMIVECLGDQVTPKSNPDDYDSLVGYYHAVWREMEAAGMDVSTFRLLSDAAAKLSRPMTPEEADQARDTLGITQGEGDQGK